jgi:hypothetical protein
MSFSIVNERNILPPSQRVLCAETVSPRIHILRDAFAPIFRAEPKSTDVVRVQIKSMM